MGPMPKEMQLLRAARIEEQKGLIKAELCVLPRLRRAQNIHQKSELNRHSSDAHPRSCTSFIAKVAELTLTSRSKK